VIYRGIVSRWGWFPSESRKIAVLYLLDIVPLWGGVLVVFFVMRIVDLCHTWRIFLTSNPQPQCLHGLALRCGYRVDEVCAELHCSPRYLHHVFMRDVGLPPKTWMRQERLLVARRLLESGESPHAVAEWVGFTLVGNFRRECLRCPSWTFDSNAGST
jgi:AraC-like DNA-binding protein